MITVLITTSGLGSRMKNLTKNTNKALLTVGNKAIISYIIESYNYDTEFVITLGHFGQLVKDFLELGYPNHKFIFVTIDNYNKDGSSLLYSMSCAKEHLQKPFIFHACDTVVTQVPLSTENWCGGYKRLGNSNYRSFNVTGTNITRINDKECEEYDYEYIGLCSIYDFKQFWEILDNLILMPNPEWSDCHVIDKMISKGTTFGYKIVDKWYDTGNLYCYERMKGEIKDTHHVLTKYDENIYFFKDFVIKFFANKETSSNRVKRSLILKPLVPLVIDSRDHFYKYLFLEGKLVSNIKDITIFSDLLEWSLKNLWIPVKSSFFKDTCYKFYIDKTKERIKSLNVFEPDITTINGIKVPTVETMLKKLPIEKLCSVTPYKFHGDFILDNILFNDNKFILLDWRQDFGGDLECGDIYYDLGKLNHNLLFNHDNVLNENYTITKTDFPPSVATQFLENNGIVTIDLHCNFHLLECREILKQFCNKNGFCYKQVEMITALIWLNMSPLHTKPLNMFLFYFGKYNLNKVLNEIS